MTELEIPSLIEDFDGFMLGLDKRLSAAARVKSLSKISGMNLRYWTEDPECALLDHQTTGSMWLYTIKKGILADPTGSGKTIMTAALLAIMKEQKELTDRAIIIVLPATLAQWQDELRRFIPRINVELVTGGLTKNQRIQRYCHSNWDVLLIGFQLYMKDWDEIQMLGIDLLVADDVDPIKEETNRTYECVKAHSDMASRAVMLTATPLQNRLHELYAFLSCVGGEKVFGRSSQFQARYVDETSVTKRDPITGRKKTKHIIMGYKNMNEFKRFVEPFYLRRDIDGLPELMPPNNIWLELHKRQREEYTLLQKGVVQLRRELADGQNAQQKRVTALARLSYGQQICAGLHCLGAPDEPGATSVKMDKAMDMITGDHANEKIVLFALNKDSIRAFHARFVAAGIGFATMWGEDRNVDHRRAAVKRFTEDPKCRIMIGTSAMERGLNLQAACHLYNIDTLLNPKRMEQLLGRIRRIGSKHMQVWVHNFLTVDTQEERYLPILEHKAALSDFVFGEATQLYRNLTTDELLALISP